MKELLLFITALLVLTFLSKWVVAIFFVALGIHFIDTIKKY
jgi:hypothetical protein